MIWPSPYDVLRVVRERPRSPSWVIRNVLHSEAKVPVLTSTVLRRLRWLERNGLVRKSSPIPRFKGAVHSWEPSVLAPAAFTKARSHVDREGKGEEDAS